MHESAAQAGVSGTAPEAQGASAADPVKRPMRPREMQDALNHYLYHPLAWQLARRLARTPITPNMVSVLGACFVIAAGVVYLQPAMGGPAHAWAWPWSALLGMVLHMTWHVVDGADGDLARLTGRTSPIGEMVDGLCDYLSHIVLYLMLGWLLSRMAGWGGGGAGWAWMGVAGISHIVQANHVEVQRRQYQWWVYGTSWLRMEHKAGSATGKSPFGALVSLYLALATGLTPHALKIDAAVAAAKDDPARRGAIAAVVRAEAGPLLKLCKVLGPNPRAIVLGLSMLAGSPLWYFVYQSIVLNALLVVSVVLHNRAAKRIAAKIGD